MGTVLDEAPYGTWQTSGECDDELHHLPRASAAEFRTAAWRLYSSASLWPRGGSYFPAIGLRGTVAATSLFLGVGGFIYDLATGQRPTVDDVLACLLATALGLLLGAWKLRSNRKVLRLQRRNRQLETMSREIDALVDQGVIPAAPPGWDGTLLAPLHRS